MYHRFLETGRVFVLHSFPFFVLKTSSYKNYHFVFFVVSMPRFYFSNVNIMTMIIMQ